METTATAIERREDREAMRSLDEAISQLERILAEWPQTKHESHEASR